MAAATRTLGPGLALCIQLIAADALPGQEGPATALDALRGSKLTIHGSTTVGTRWSCTATDITAWATTRDAALGITLRAIHAVSVVVPVANLRCQSEAMDRVMRKAMRADNDSASAIVGRFASRPPRSAHDTLAASAARLDGTLTVAGVQRGVTLDVTLRPLRDRVVRVQSAMPLTLSGFNIVRPRVLFGAVRARDAITVEVDLLFLSDSLGLSRT